MTNPRLLVFDLDGTLIDSRQDIAQAVNVALQDCDLESLSIDKIASFVGNGVTSLIHASLGPHDSERIFRKAIKRFRAYYEKHLLENTFPYEGVQELLNGMRQVDKVVLTNKPGHFAIKILEGLGFEKDFQEIIGGNAPFPKKPDPTSLLYLMEKFQIHKTRVLMIGDSPMDILTGKNAGIKTCAVTYGFGKREALIEAGPDYIVDHPGQIESIIDVS